MPGLLHLLLRSTYNTAASQNHPAAWSDRVLRNLSQWDSFCDIWWSAILNLMHDFPSHSSALKLSSCTCRSLLGTHRLIYFSPKKSDSDQTVMSINGINKIKKSFLALWNLHSAEKWVVIWTVTIQFQCVLFTGSCLKWISRSLQAFSMEVCHFRIYSTEFLSYATCYNALDFFFFPLT